LNVFSNNNCDNSSYSAKAKKLICFKTTLALSSKSFLFSFLKMLQLWSFGLYSAKNLVCLLLAI
jgi:hypothetical protein